MAITIKIEPEELVPAYNEVILVLDSDKKNEPKFQFVIDITVGTENSPSLRFSPNPDGYGVINLGRYLESFVSFDIDHTDNTLFRDMTNDYKQYTVALSEEYVVTNHFTTITDNGGFSQYNYTSAHNYIVGDYITVTGATSSPVNNGNQLITSVPTSTSIVTNIAYNVTSIGDSVLSNNAVTILPSSTKMTGNKYIFNGVLEWQDYPNWDYTQYVMSSATPGKFLSTIGTKKTKVSLSDRSWVNYYQQGTGVAGLRVISNNGTFIYANPLSSFTNRVLSIGVSPDNLINTTIIPTVISGSLPVLDSNSTSYTVELVNTIQATISEIMNFEIVDNCSIYEKFRIVFMDRMGSFQNLDFDLLSKNSTNVKRTTYNKNYATYTSRTYTLLF